MGRLQELVGARHPEGVPHWHLSRTAVLPGLRGRGLGGALLRYQLARADEEETAAYLEAGTPRDGALYERCGFRALGAPTALPDGGPEIQPMWRAGLSAPRVH
ncbi:GNAT family N-acetyltransferase [Streptomyces sp. MP131-18]|uniref:GNAT family N-acetyltransferase n=1 Tax=Streptomyces sp. MP131-18 TaxID=1857892 RepID=UPI0015C53FCE|nr:GNAT family N-acetyltransferase [Streptomyces sp. MP131-18]